MDHFPQDPYGSLTGHSCATAPWLYKKTTFGGYEIKFNGYVTEILFTNEANLFINGEVNQPNKCS